jgi:NAD(P)H-dependent FMN reductase
MSKIALIITSTRKGRVGAEVGKWLTPILTESLSSDATLTTVDVADFNLPVFDEPSLPAMIPAAAQWATPHGKAWSDEIEKYDAYVLLANEYNFGMSGATKNAIDFLYHAWIGKPIFIVTYGIMGGSQASEQLKGVLTGMKLKVVETRPQLSFVGGPYGEDLKQAFGGVLAATTQEEWTKEKKVEIVKGVEELKESIKQKAAEGQGIQT